MADKNITIQSMKSIQKMLTFCEVDEVVLGGVSNFFWNFWILWMRKAQT